MTEQLELRFDGSKVCPFCGGRTGDPLWVLEPLCREHDSFPRVSDDEIRESLEQGRRDAEAFIRWHRQAVARLLADPTLF